MTIWILAFAVGFVPYFVGFSTIDKDRSIPAVSSQWPHCSIQIERYKNLTFLRNKLNYESAIQFPVVLYSRNQV